MAEARRAESAAWELTTRLVKEGSGRLVSGASKRAKKRRRRLGRDDEEEGGMKGCFQRARTTRTGQIFRQKPKGVLGRRRGRMLGFRESRRRKKGSCLAKRPVKERSVSLKDSQKDQRTHQRALSFHKLLQDAQNPHNSLKLFDLVVLVVSAVERWVPMNTRCKECLSWELGRWAEAWR